MPENDTPDPTPVHTPSAGAAALTARGTVNLWVPEWILVMKPEGRVASAWQKRGHALEAWPEDGAIIPAHLASGEDGLRRIVLLNKERIEELRRDLMAFKGLYQHPRKLQNPADLLWFVNKWGMPEWGSFYGGERVERVRNLLRSLVEASIGPEHAAREIPQLVPANGITVSSTIRYVGNQWITETVALELQSLLTVLLSEWARTPASVCANPQCGELVFERKYCDQVCANRVQTRRAKKMQRVRNALIRGEAPQAIADKYGVSVADVAAQRHALKQAGRRRQPRRKEKR